MTAASGSDRREQWALVIRRSFAIPDDVGADDARKTIIGYLEGQLRENGWQGPTRTVAEPIVDALIAAGAGGDRDDPLALLSNATFTGRDAAHRLLVMGLMIVDPEHLVFDARSGYPPEIIAAVEQVVDRVSHYVRELPFGH